MKEQETTYLFPEKATVQESASILQDLTGLLRKKGIIVLSFENIHTIDLSVVQLTLSFLKTLDKNSRGFDIKEPLSAAAQDAFSLAGILVRQESSALSLKNNLRTLIKEHS